MNTVMKVNEFVSELETIEKKYKTLYVMGCFGAPLNDANKERYTRNHSYNRQVTRVAMIKSATPDTFGFDCVNLIKAVLWGWNGDKTKTYGGSKYKSNNVPDIGADEMIRHCKDVSTDFSKIEIGEAVWMEGHIGVYVGNGLAIDCTPAWKNGVQYTACNRTVSGYKRRNWTKHGKLPWIDYTKVATSNKVENKTESKATSYSLTEFIKDIQQAIDAKIDGIAGPETLSKTLTLSSKLNNKHPAVYYVQRRLKALGYEEIGKVDGIAGPMFTSAVAHFQMDNDCYVDGEITAREKTWKKLLGMA